MVVAVQPDAMGGAPWLGARGLSELQRTAVCVCDLVCERALPFCLISQKDTFGVKAFSPSKPHTLSRWNVGTLPGATDNIHANKLPCSPATYDGCEQHLVYPFDHHFLVLNHFGRQTRRFLIESQHFLWRRLPFHSR